MSRFLDFTPLSDSLTGTANNQYQASTNDNYAAIIIAGYMNDVVEKGLVEVLDILYVTYDVDGTPAAQWFQVQADGDNYNLVPATAIGTYTVLNFGEGASIYDDDTQTLFITSQYDIVLQPLAGRQIILDGEIDATGALYIDFSGGLQLPTYPQFAGQFGFLGEATLNGSGTVTLTAGSLGDNSLVCAWGLTATGAIRAVNNGDGTLTITSSEGAADSGLIVAFEIKNPNF